MASHCIDANKQGDAMSEITQFQILNDKWVRYDDHLAYVERLTAKRDEAQAAVLKLARQNIERFDEINRLKNAIDHLTSERDDHRAEVERLTAERDAALAEVERLTNERDKARANGQAILNSSRPDDDHRAMVRRLTAERDAAEEIGRRILALIEAGR